MDEEKRIVHKEMGHGTVIKESGDYYEIEWDVKPLFDQNGGRKVSSVPKDHVKECCGEDCNEEKECNCGPDGMCSDCEDEEYDDWLDEDDILDIQGAWDDMSDEEKEELEEFLKEFL